MKTIKDENLSLITRTYIYRDAPLLLVAAMAGFHFSRPGDLLEEGQLWEVAEACFGKEDYLDQSFPRPTGEVILRARCYTPNGRPLPACPVSFQVGALKKALHVFGDRRWNSQAGIYTGVSNPVPFTEMDISWENAFGGPGSSLNPRGKGMAKLTDPSGRPYLPLPNVEDPADLVCVPEKLYKPRSFDYAGPQGIGQEDIGLFGTYDDNWRIHRWPYLPDDFNIEAAYASPRDQRLHEGFFRGDEPVILENMHPRQPHIRTTLPGLRVRLFTRSVKFDLPVFGEHAVDLDKIWLFPHLETGILIWHAMISVGNEEADDLTHLLAFTERLDEAPQPASCYSAMITDVPGEETTPPEPPPSAPVPEEPAVASQVSSGAPKSGIAGAVAMAAAGSTIIAAAAKAEEGMDAGELAHLHSLMQAWAGKLAAQEEELDRKLKEIGVDAQPLNDEKEPPPLPEPRDDLDLESALGKQESLMAAAEEELRHVLAIAGIDPDLLPPRTEAPQMKSLSEIAADMKQMGLEGTELFGIVLAMGKALEEVEKEKAAILAAPKLPAPREEIGTEVEMPREPEKAYLTRDDVLARHAAGDDLSGLDLTGIDLSACDLRGIRLRETILEKANLTGTDLGGGDLTDAVLTGADCSGARLTGAVLNGIAAQGLQAERADFSGAGMTLADLAGANLAGASVKDTCLDEANLEGAFLKGANFEDASGASVNFGGADLTGALMSRCRLPRADFSDACLNAAAFGQGDLTEASFHGAVGEGTQFAGATMTGARSNGAAIFRRGDFQGADLNAASFQDSTFEECLFVKARLDSSLFMNCRFLGSSFYRATAREARFDFADLSRTNMVAVNLFQASLRKAVLYHCDLEGANLFAVDFYEAVFRETDLQGANLKRTFFDRWTPLRL